MQDYIKDMKFSNPSDGELLTEICYVEVLEEGTNKWSKKLLAFSNLGIFLFTPSTNRACSICPPDALCPDGPTLYSKVTYQDVFTFEKIQNNFN